MNKYTVWILVLVIFIRLYLIILPSFRIDMNSWQAWSTRLAEVTPLHFYAPNYFSDYFPGYLYMLWFLGLTFKLLFSTLSIFSLPFEYYLKFFTNVFDIATAYFIYKIICNYKQKAGFWAAIFYLANPALFFNSSVWGQIDGILTFFLVYSAYCLLELKSAYRFSISSSLSILVKPQGLAIFPVTIIYLITNYKYKKYFSLLLIPIFLILLSLPFFLKDPVLGLFHLFQKSANTYPYTSMFSYNFWAFAGWWIPDSTKFSAVTYQAWGIIIYLVMLVFILGPLIIKKGYKNNFLIYFAMALASFAFFLFLTRIHQRYLFPFFAFLAVSAFIKNSMKLKIIYTALSLIHFINLWYVYYYYNYVYTNPKFSSLLIFKFLSANYNLFTLFNLLGFGLLILIYYINTKEKHVQKIS
ncbi:hypothetical protein HYU45_01785 [Candidatus Daviesbacteria bacterium]|nr:hypothetical protein [Candidatus Daviesbacteria bacterium]